MKRSKFLRGPCSHCGAPIRYAADLIGTSMQCPRCGETTELLLEELHAEPTIPRRVVFWTVVSVLALLIGLGASMYALKRTQRWAEEHKPAAATNSPVNQ